MIPSFVKIQAILVKSAFETLGVSVIVIGMKNSPPRTTALPCGGLIIFANCDQIVKFSDNVYVRYLIVMVIPHIPTVTF